MQSKTSTAERSLEPSSNGSGLTKEAEQLLAEMPADQQKQLAQIYFFLTQVSHPAYCLFVAALLLGSRHPERGVLRLWLPHQSNVKEAKGLIRPYHLLALGRLSQHHHMC